MSFLAPEFRDNMKDDQNHKAKMMFSESDIEKVRFDLKQEVYDEVHTLPTFHKTKSIIP